MGTAGMQWEDLNDTDNGMKVVMILMSIEWVVLLLVSYYLDQAGSFRHAIRKYILRSQKKPSLSTETPSLRHQQSKVIVEMDKYDVIQEVSL